MTNPVRRGDGETLLERSALAELIAVLAARGYRVVGPTVADGAIVYDEVTSLEDLPEGWGDEQDGGTYRLRRRDDEALFGYAVGPQSWKKLLFPPHTLLWRARRSSQGFDVESDASEEGPYAFIGVRACELAAIKVQDRVFMGMYTDPTYASARSSAFIVAVNCSTPAGTCFCVSMDTGPRADSGFDLALTEVVEEERHYFVCEVGSERGADVLAEISPRPAEPEEVGAADGVVQRAADQMGRHMRTDGIKELLYGNLEHPRWDDVASRCLACGNCTLVCPTCFCSTVEDTSDLTGDTAERWRSWDSCFTLDFSEVGGDSVRSSTRSRYRQWMTHKLATWLDQFGTSGCVGCGRCITWCPVGIDITEEVSAIRGDGADAR